ncbi:MAG: hypothetical protein FWB96_01290 [Defluviitaleaceae bacterium]|nr:hypothetical protein [Defluviitaleaceae bacterium]MCL2261673.1 hypothetical protein [Defluviitaleaceae bacterium]
MTFTEKPAPLGIGKWYRGKQELENDRELSAWVKTVDNPVLDCYGINGGKIVCLEIKIGDEVIADFNGDWVIPIPDAVKPLYESILQKFN